MRPHPPEVTVGVPVWNGERYLAKALAALRDQDLDDVEFVVADNGSTDGTVEIARSFAAEDDRFSVMTSAENRGVTWNFNRLLDAARAPLFMWNAADDVVLPGHLAACRDALRDHPEATIAFSRVVLIGPDDEVLGERDDLDLDFLDRGPAARLHLFFARQVYQVIGYGGVIRTDVLRRMGGHPDFYGGDMALASRMALRAPWVQVPEQLFLARNHEEQTNKLQGGADPVQQTRTYREHRRAFAFPQWYLNHRLLMEAVTAPVPAAERAKAAGVVLRDWTLANWRFFPYDVKRNLQLLRAGAGTA
ncbi:glycosyltransferase family 2 protein [Isoptericola sp. NPDC055881]